MAIDNDKLHEQLVFFFGTHYGHGYTANDHYHAADTVLSYLPMPELQCPNEQEAK